MAVFKCKMCGGELNLIKDTNVCECEYCGTTQTVPSADDEKKMNLFNRANRLRFANEFDKAAGVFESIVAEFPEEAEAYWGLVLCKYGIEYVDDSATAKKIPTCHRTSYDRIFEDDDFQMALEYADPIANRVYREEAKEIDRLQKAILEVADKEEPFDIFICYKETAEDGQRTKDSVMAQDIYDALTAKGYKVFFSRITLEDKLGQEYEPYIFAALNSAKIMLAVGTKYEYFNAVWVKNEWARFLELIKKDKNKVLIPCYCDIDAYDMPLEFKNFQGQDMSKVGFVQDLLRGVEKIILLEKESEKAPAQVAQTASSPNVMSLLERAELFLEDEDWDSVEEYCDRVLDIEPKNVTAYLYMTCAHFHMRNINDLSTVEENIEAFDSFKKAYRFADDKMKILLDEVILKVNIRRNEEAKRKQTEEQRKKAEEQYKQVNVEEKKKEIKEIRDLVNSANIFPICDRTNIVAGLKADGTVVANGESYSDLCEISEWRDIIKIFDLGLGIGGLKADGTVVGAGINKYGEWDVSEWKDIVSIYSYYFDHTIGLKADGTVVATGEYIFDKYDVLKWKDIISIYCDKYYTIGLKADGTVVAAGINSYGACNVSEWKDIASIYCTNERTIGLKADGTVVATGRNDYGECNVSEWKDIVSIECRWENTIGLKSDGTVVMAGRNDYGQCNVSEWKDIISIYCDGENTIGLKADGTVVATGRNRYGECNVSEWRDIVSIDCYEENTIGLKADGTVVATGRNRYGECNVSEWRDIVSIDCSGEHTIGLKADGTVVVVGKYKDDEYNISGWKLFDNKNQLREMAEKQAEYNERIKKHPEEIKKRNEEAIIEKKRLEEERRERRARNVCQYCGGKFKGLLSKKCVDCGKLKNY